MSRECRKCGEYIPYQVTIDGEIRNLQNRKFCLKCSSFKGRNTSPNDPVIRRAKVWKLYSEKQKDSVKICNYKRALQLRRELYLKSGGKCSKCGYYQCERALTFHHRNHEEKSFGLSLNQLWSKDRDSIFKEWEKCELLCMNCHAEVEDAISRKTSIVQRVNEKYGTDF